MISDQQVVPSGPLIRITQEPMQFKNTVLGFFYAHAVAFALNIVNTCKHILSLCGGYVVEVVNTLRLSHGNG
jgi:hypothetical protein